jgi:hypothetical protein
VDGHDHSAGNSSVSADTGRGDQQTFAGRPLKPEAAEGNLTELSQFSIVTFERRPGCWRASITPLKPSSSFVRGQTTSSIVTSDDFQSEAEAKSAAEKMIRKL